MMVRMRMRFVGVSEIIFFFFLAIWAPVGDTTPPPQPPGKPRARSVGVNGCEKGMSEELFGGGDQDDDQLITNSRSGLMTL